MFIGNKKKKKQITEKKNSNHSHWLATSEVKLLSSTMVTRNRSN